MLVGEVIRRKNETKRKIEELEFYLEKLSNVPNIKESAVIYTDVLSNVFSLLDEYQSYLILLERSNIKNEIKVGSSNVKVSDAVKLRDATNKKMEFITSLINNNDASLNVPDLMTNRDKLMEEFILINNSIEKSDWSANVD